MARGAAEEMRERLGRELAVALAPHAWVPATPTRVSSFYLAEFVRPLHDDMAATASVGRAGSIPDRPPVWVTHVHVGVSYEPLRRLWTLLGDDYRLALIHERVFPDDSVEQEGDEDRRLKVSSDAEAEAAVDKIAGLVLREAIPFAERYRGVEALLDEFGFDEQQGVVVRRYIDSGGDPSIVPHEPPPSPYETSEKRPVLQRSGAKAVLETQRSRSSGE